MKWLIPFAIVTLLWPSRTWTLQSTAAMSVQADARDADEGRMIVMKDSFKAITGPSSVGVVEQPSRPRESYLAVVTAYSSTYDQTDGSPHITASGTRTSPSTIACPRRYAFRTRIWVEGVGERVCEDRLAPRYDSRFDIWFPTREEAIQFGKQTKIVEIL